MMTLWRGWKLAGAGGGVIEGMPDGDDVSLMLVEEGWDGGGCEAGEACGMAGLLCSDEVVF